MNSINKYKFDYNVLGFISVIIFLLFFRPEIAFNMPSTIDDSCYLKWLYKFMGKTYSGFCVGDYLPGIALLWLPLALIFSAISFVTGFSHYTLILTSIIVSAYLFWVGTLLVAIKITRKLNLRDSIAIMWIFSVPILYYCTARVHFAHPGELFCSTLMVYFILKNQNLKATITYVLLFLTRVNNFPAILLIFTLLFNTHKPKKPFLKLNYTIFYILLLSGTIVIFTYLGFFRGYNSVTFYTILSRLSLERLIHVLTGTDWGLLWTAPAWLFIVIIGITNFLKLSWLSRMGIIWMIVELICCVGWTGNGGDFAYRYLIGSYTVILIIWSDISKHPTILTKIGKYLLLINAIWITFLTWIYRTYPLFSPQRISIRNIHLLPHFQLKALVWLFEPLRLIEPIRLSSIPVVICSWFPQKWCKNLYGIDIPILKFDQLVVLMIITITTLVIGVFSLYRLLHFSKKR